MREHLVPSLAAAAMSMALAWSAVSAQAPSSRIFIASDSTAAPYPASRYPQMGWGQVLGCSLTPGVGVENFAKGGRSTRTFIAEGWLEKINAALRPGDTLLIQFGHNDEYEVRPERYTPIPDFKAHLATYVQTARAKGAQPILLTPVTKREFGRNGRLENSLAEYAEAVRQVAAETKTPLIDLNADSQAALLALGPEGSRRAYLYYGPKEVAAYPDGISDNTHFSEAGARLMAGLVAHRLAGLGVGVSAQVRPSAAANAAILGGDDCPTTSSARAATETAPG